MDYRIECVNGAYNVMLGDKLIYSASHFEAAQMYIDHMQRAH